MPDPDKDKPPGGKPDDNGKPEAKEGDKENKQGEDKKEDKPQPRPARWPWVAGGLVVLAFAAFVLYRIFAPRPDVWTDDAYVTVHYASISPRVSGYVMSVLVTDNQAVRAGQLLVQLDPADFQTAVASAEAAVERDTSQVGNVSANLARQPSLTTEQEANVASAQARLTFSAQDQRRYTNLASTGAGTAQQHQQADATMQQNRASLAGAQSALDASRKQMQVLQAQKSASEGTVKADQAQLDQARLNLSYTRIVTPFDGTVGQLSVQAGNNVAPGTVMMAVVPLQAVYIVANYREVDLRHVRPGQDVTIHLDAYNIDLRGVVDSLPPASGGSFAPIPPNNATGNFITIVQRLPVKITVRPDQPQARLLRVGFSVETTIHTGLEDVAGEQAAFPGRVSAP